LQVTQFPARFDAQFSGQQDAGAGERGQRVRLPARPVQRHHQLRVETFPVRAFAGQRLQLRYQLLVLS